MLEESVYGDYRPQSGVVLGDDGLLYVAGHTSSPDFPTTPGAYQPSFAGGQDAFVVAVDPAASGSASLVWSTLLGGSLVDEASTIDLAPDGTIYIAGQTLSHDLPGAPADLLSGGAGDAFVARLSGDGSSLLSAARIAGTGADDARSVAVVERGAASAVAVAGITAGGFASTPNAVQTQSGGGNDGFVGVLSGDLGSVESLTYLGGSGEDEAWGLGVLTGGSLFVGGGTDSDDEPAGEGTRARGGSLDGFSVSLRA